MTVSTIKSVSACAALGRCMYCPRDVLVDGATLPDQPHRPQLLDVA